MCYVSKYDSIKYDSIKYDSIKYDSIKYDSIKYDFNGTLKPSFLHHQT